MKTAIAALVALGLVASQASANQNRPLGIGLRRRQFAVSHDVCRDRIKCLRSIGEPGELGRSIVRVR